MFCFPLMITLTRAKRMGVILRHSKYAGEGLRSLFEYLRVTPRAHFYNNSVAKLASSLRSPFCRVICAYSGWSLALSIK